RTGCGLPVRPGRFGPHRIVAGGGGDAAVGRGGDAVVRRDGRRDGDAAGGRRGRRGRGGGGVHPAIRAGRHDGGVHDPRAQRQPGAQGVAGGKGRRVGGGAGGPRGVGPPGRG